MANEIRDLALRYQERCKALGLKGKKADEYALEYFVGAAAGAELAGNKDLAQTIGRTAALIIAVRGYIGVSSLAHALKD